MKNTIRLRISDAKETIDSLLNDGEPFSLRCHDMTGLINGHIPAVDKSGRMFAKAQVQSEFHWFKFVTNSQNPVISIEKHKPVFQ